MNTTVNISIPKNMYFGAKQMLVKKGYASISELFRDLLRDVLYPKLTVNGFTPEFEDMVLEAEKEPIENDIVLKTNKDVDNYFSRLENSIIKNAKNKRNGKVQKDVKGINYQGF